MNEKTGDKSFQEMVMKTTASQDPPKVDMLGQIYNTRVKNPLPPKDAATMLVTGK